MNMEFSIVRRKRWFLLGVLLCVAWTVNFLSPCWAAAPDQKPAAAAAGEEKAVAAGGEEKAASPAGEEKKGSPQQSFLAWVIQSSGIIGLVILLLSIYFVSTVGRLFWEMRIDVAAPPQKITQCEELLEQRDFKGIYNLVKDDTPFSAVC